MLLQLVPPIVLLVMVDFRHYYTLFSLCGLKNSPSLELLGYGWFLKKLQGKWEGKKIERKNRIQEKNEGKKIDLKSINHLYILLQTLFTYLMYLCKD